MTRLFRAFAALLLSFNAPLAAQHSHPAPQPVLAEPAQEVLKPALWKVSDADSSVYLFGTIHALPKGLVWLEGPVANALETSDELVTEIPSVKPEDLAPLVMRRAVLPKGQSLRTLLSVQDYAAYDQAMTAQGIPGIAFAGFKPWYVALTLTIMPLLRDGYAVESGVEQQLAARAAALGKRHDALETIDYQLNLFDAMPMDAQCKFLMAAVAGQADARPQLDQLVAEWGQGHATKLAALLNQEGDDPAARAAFLTDRNRNWSTWVEQRLTRPGSAFVAVGTAHLAGNDSVVDLLTQRGLTVVRVQ